MTTSRDTTRKPTEAGKCDSVTQVRRLLCRAAHASAVPFMGGRGSSPVVLMYHGITDDPRVANQFWTQLGVEQFAQHMQHLSRAYHAVPLSAVARFCRGELALPARAVAVTFDDGYENNYRTAKPILEQYQIPATIFCVSEFVNSADMLWTDKLRVALQELASVKRSFKAVWQRINRVLQGYGHVSSDNLLETLKQVPHDLKDDVVDCLLAEIGSIPSLSAFPDLRGLGLESLIDLATSPLIEIGAHTTTHEILTQCPPSILATQIRNSKHQLSGLISSEVVSFAYPNGNYNRDVLDQVMSAGFDCAVTTRWGYARRNEAFEIPRIAIGSDGTADIEFFKLAVAGVLPAGTLNPLKLMKASLKRSLPGKVWNGMAQYRQHRRQRKRKPAWKEEMATSSRTSELLMSGRVRAVHFVCQGNIIRSPFASAYLDALLGGGGIITSSSGLWAQAGRRAHLYALEISEHFGVSLAQHRATKTDPSVLRNADMIVCFERWHVAACLKLDSSLGHKILLLGSLRQPDNQPEVDDPYGKPLSEFRQALAEIAALVSALADAIGSSQRIILDDRVKTRG